jgi:large subunit ribosomal protein L25
MAQFTLPARPRREAGKGAARRLRREHQIPAVFYGAEKKESSMLAVSYADLQKIIRQTSGENVILGLEISTESGVDSRTVMLKELQVDPCTDRYLHADFYEISMDKELTLEIPVRLMNTPAGVTDGGVLQHVRREITVSCLPGKLVEYLEVDVSGLNIGDSVHIKDIELPEGIRTAEEGHLTVAVVAAPTVAPEVTEEEEEAEIAEEAAEAEGGEPEAPSE